MPNGRETLLQVIESQPVIDGRFTAIKRIGASGGNGHFSMLFSAHDTSSGRSVALKFLRPDLITEPYRWTSFQREEEVTHEFVGQSDVVQWVAPYSIFTIPLTTPQGFVYPMQVPYFGLELASDRNVGDVILDGEMNTPWILGTFQAMARGVQRMHAAGIAHRDLKPSNFLIMLDGSIKLSDLGTARNVRDDQQQIMKIYDFAPGDKRYTAPEIIACLHDVHPRIALAADVYALGATWFELITGSELVHHVFPPNFIDDLTAYMVNVPREKRKETYDKFVGDIARAHPLPSLGDFRIEIPSCIHRPVDALYRSLATLDYRMRWRDFQRIFNHIQICSVTLRNEEKYHRMLEERRRRRQVAASRHAVGGERK